MSYDLFFRPRRAAPSKEDLAAWFAGRVHYQLNETQAFYENASTGVYFSFDLDSPAFNINYFRPHVFALEAEPELSAFVQHFDLEISDPQSDGMGDGPYSAEGFIRGWNAGNRFAHRAMMSHDVRPRDLRSLPTQTIHNVWSWNYHKPAYEDLLCSVEMTVGFVPTIMLLERDREPGRVFTAVIWADAMPIAMPRVDNVLVAGALSPSAPTLVPFDRVEPLLASYPRRDGHRFTLDSIAREVALPHLMVDHDLPPPGLISDLRALLPREPEALSRIPMDQVLDRELVTSYS